MTTETCSADEKDLAAGRLTLALIWWLPTAAIVAAIFLASPVRTFIWTASLSWMGMACLLNANRCGRLHCYFTGPLFLLGAAASLMHGVPILSLGPNGWAWIGYSVLIGGLVLNYLPEWIWGKYTSRALAKSQPTP